MIPVLHSIDSLLNRFDELSQRHAHFVSDFDRNFAGMDNPLHRVARDEEEQRKTAENLSMANMESNDPVGSYGTVEDFNRRITKSRSSHRPPSYCSNDSSFVLHRVPSRSSWATTESAPLPRRIIASAITVTSTSQPEASVSMENLIESRSRTAIKAKPKIVPQNLPVSRRYARSAITTFTLETAVRLSKPKTCHQSPDLSVSPKRVHRRQREVRQTSAPRSQTAVSSQIKRTNPIIIRSPPKKFKIENRSVTDHSKRTPTNNYSRPTVFLAPPPTICLTFPMQPDLKLARMAVLSKAIPTTASKKLMTIHANKRFILQPNRMMHLMT